MDVPHFSSDFFSKRPTPSPLYPIFPPCLFFHAPHRNFLFESEVFVPRKLLSGRHPFACSEKAGFFPLPLSTSSVFHAAFFLGSPIPRSLPRWPFTNRSSPVKTTGSLRFFFFGGHPPFWNPLRLRQVLPPLLSLSKALLKFLSKVGWKHIKARVMNVSSGALFPTTKSDHVFLTFRTCVSRAHRPLSMRPERVLNVVRIRVFLTPIAPRSRVGWFHAFPLPSPARNPTLRDCTPSNFLPFSHPKPGGRSPFVPARSRVGFSDFARPQWTDIVPFFPVFWTGLLFHFNFPSFFPPPHQGFGITRHTQSSSPRPLFLLFGGCPFFFFPPL